MNIKIPTRVNLSEAARNAMVGVSSYKEGAKSLLAMTRNDPALLTALLEPYELQAATGAVQKAVADFRKRTWSSPNRKIEETRVAALAQSNRETLLDFPLPGGMSLRDANRGDVAEAIAFYNVHSKDMAHKARWLARIVGKVPKNSTVGQVLGNDDLEKMQKDSENG